MTRVESSHPHLPHPVSGSVVLTQEEHGLHYTTNATWSDGRANQVSIVFALDGEWHPAVGSLIMDSVCSRLHEDGVLEAKLRSGGVESGSLRAWVSEDQRILVSQWEVLYPRGFIVKWIIEAERQ